jgi:N utilization substance protein B
MASGTPRPRTRTGSRVAAVQALFQAEQGPTATETVIDEFIRYRLGKLDDAGFEDGRIPDVDVKLFARIVRTASLHQDTIDPLLSNSLAEDWPLARLDPVLRALMRAGAAELSMTDGAPAKVVINEYLDVAHGFFEGDEPRMANGVLDRIAHVLRPAEFALKE